MMVHALRVACRAAPCIGVRHRKHHPLAYCSSSHHFVWLILQSSVLLVFSPSSPKGLLIDTERTHTARRLHVK